MADDKAVYTYVPEMIRYYLGEEPILANVPTYRLDHEDEQMAGARPPRRAGAQAGGRRRAATAWSSGPRPASEELDRLREAVLDDPRALDRPGGRASCRPSPTHCGDRLGPRHVDLRPFAVNDGERVWVVPGGLTRVALPEGSLVVNSSQGGGSKDTWVLAGDGRRPRRCRRPGERQWGGAPSGAGGRPRPGPVAADRRPAAQQQQQQRAGEPPC